MLSGKNGRRKNQPRNPNARQNLEKLNSALSKIYYDPSHPASYGGVDKLFKALRGKYTKKQVQDWLAGQEAYALHKNVVRKFKRNRMYVDNIGDQFQADLNDMRHLSKHNDEYKYILTCIDCFSRYAWAIPLKDKTPTSVKEAFKIIFKAAKPLKLQTDKGKEFLGNVFQSFLKEEKVIHFSTENDDAKAVMVERFNRTLKTRMTRYFEKNNTRRYIDVLSKLVHSYNHTVHSSIKMAPAQVNEDNMGQVWATLYGKKQVITVPKYAIGDLVRISRSKDKFEKGYDANFSREIFRIVKVFKAHHPIYALEDLNGEPIKGKFYEKEVQKVFEPQAHKVEKVLRSRKVRGKTQYFVKWLGYSSNFNSWVEDVVLPDPPI